jgi:hypothetical protein
MPDTIQGQNESDVKTSGENSSSGVEGENKDPLVKLGEDIEELRNEISKEVREMKRKLGKQDRLMQYVILVLLFMLAGLFLDVLLARIWNTPSTSPSPAVIIENAYGIKSEH